MRSLERWLILVACGLLLVFAAPALSDDVVLVTAPGTIRIGALALEPGSYLLRSASSMGSRHVVMVMSPDESRFYGLVLANHDSSPRLKCPTDQLVFDEADGRTLKSWVVAWREVGYFFSTAEVPPAMAARVRAGSGVRKAAR